MNIEPIQPESLCDNHLLKDESTIGDRLGLDKFSNVLNHKISGLAQSKIPQNTSQILCEHHVVAAPQVMLNILLKKSFKINFFDKKKKKESCFITTPKKQKKPKEDYHLKKEKSLSRNKKLVPIGILPFDSNRWINALLQFILFVPSLRMMFDYTPKSFASFNDFIDIYLNDQKAGKYITTAPVSPIDRMFSKCIGKCKFFKNDVVSIFGILDVIMKSVSSLDDVTEMDLMRDGNLSLFPEWRISVEKENVDLQEYIGKQLSKQFHEKHFFPYELLIDFNWFSHKEKRENIQCRASMVLNFYEDMFVSKRYDLDAFVEFRPDEFGAATYITYVKINDSWFQCDDMRIKQISSDNLKIALSRSFLFHYKKMRFPKDLKKIV